MVLMCSRLTFIVISLASDVMTCSVSNSNHRNSFRNLFNVCVVHFMMDSRSNCFLFRLILFVRSDHAQFDALDCHKIWIWKQKYTNFQLKCTFLRSPNIEHANFRAANKLSSIIHLRPGSNECTSKTKSSFTFCCTLNVHNIHYRLVPIIYAW